MRQVKIELVINIDETKIDPEEDNYPTYVDDLRFRFSEYARSVIRDRSENYGDLLSVFVTESYVGDI